MRPHLFLLPVCCLTLSAQDPWETWVREAVNPEPEAHPAWYFVHRAGISDASCFSEALLPAQAVGEFRVLEVPEAVLRALGERSGRIPPPAWALLDALGQVQLQGIGEPQAQDLRAAMEAAGWSPRWEQRQSFLQAHPNHGDAVLDAVAEAQRRFLEYRFILEAPRQKGAYMAVMWKEGDAPDPEMTRVLASPSGRDLLLTPYQQALRAARALPLEDPESSEGWKDVISMAMGGAGSQEALVGDLREVARQVEDQLRRDPGRESLWEVWRALAAVLPDLDGAALAATLQPAPGATWPLRVAAEAISFRLPPHQRLDLAEAGLSDPGAGPARLEAWSGIKLGALLALKRFEDANIWIQEARRVHLGAFGNHAPTHWLSEKHPFFNHLAAALQEDPPVPQVEVPQGIGLVALGRPPWLGAFEALERHPDLDPWGRGWVMFPGELTVLHLEGKAEADLRKRLNLPEGPRWVLFRGEGELLDQGTAAPDAPRITQALRRVGPPMLERLEAFLRSHPDHRQAQARLVLELSERMPHPRLELKLAQACARLGEAPILRSADFKPQLPLWEPSARRALPGAEARLRRWPEHLDAWMAWMDWQSVRDRPSSPADFLRGLAVWKTLARGGPGPLPLEVATAVAIRLEEAARWKDLADWGIYQLEGGWIRALGREPNNPGRIGSVVYERHQKAKKDLETLTRSTLRALAKLGRKADLQRLQSAWRAQDPQAGVELGRVTP